MILDELRQARFVERPSYCEASCLEASDCRSRAYGVRDQLKEVDEPGTGCMNLLQLVSEGTLLTTPAA